MRVTMRSGLNTAALKSGDTLVLDLRQPAVQPLRVNQEDLILSDDFGRIRRGAMVSMATGTAEVVKVSEEDQEISLRGPFGGVQNLDVRNGIAGGPFNDLELGDCVDLRLIQPIAIASLFAGSPDQTSPLEARARTTSPRVTTPTGFFSASSTNSL